MTGANTTKKLKLCGSFREYNSYFLNVFAGHAYSHDEISCHRAVRTYAKVSAVIICGKSRLTGRITEFRKSRQKCGVNCRRHTDFEKICKYQWVFSRCNVNICTDCKYAFVVAAVTQQKIDFYDHISCN